MPELALIYPKWQKIPEQTEFHLPPHGPVCVAASVPDDFNITFVDENVDDIDFSIKPDVVLMSMMLTCQLPRGREIAARYREMNIPVIGGGIAAMLHAEEVAGFVDSIFLGETEDGRLAGVLDDLKKDSLKPVYDFFHDFPPIESVGSANRSILNRERYM